MCGIAGFVGQQVNATTENEMVLRQMLAAIAHRGPDGEGLWLGPGAALGHRRLAILDPAGGAQPLWNETHSIAVVYNGELYNAPLLRIELEQMGHHFRTRCDTEILVHGWEAWGRDLPDRLRGMFAFALWDTRTQTLFCARDPFGIKPFCYYPTGNGLLFASESKALLHHPKFCQKLDVSRLELYLSFQYSPGEGSFFAGVYKLPPAHWLEWRAGHLTTQAYWKPVFRPVQGLSAAAWCDRIHTAMTASVKAHLLSDVPVGGFLSSGVDSSYITALSGVKQVFTVSYEEKRYSELDTARYTANLLGTDLTPVALNPTDFLASIDQVQYAMDEPLGDASAPALYALAKQAAQEVKVCLSGEGADELFGGYNVYTEPFSHTWYDRIPGPIRRMIGEAAGFLPPAPGLNFLIRRSLPLCQRYIGNTNLMTERQKRLLLTQYEGVIRPIDLARPHLEQAAGLGPVLQMQQCDINLWLAGDILQKADRMSMAHGLEVRVPFLDREVFEVAAALPAEFRADAEHTKIALRAAAGQILPPALAQRRKLGFPAPVRDWLARPDWMAAIEQEFSGDAARSYFRPQALRRLLEGYRQGQTELWRQLWCIYAFLAWHRAYFGP